MTVDETRKVEAIVRDQITRKLKVDTREVPLAQAGTD